MGESLELEDPTRALPVAETTPPLGGGPVPRPPSGPHREGVIDWRTIDPATIREGGLLVEELLTYREQID